MNSIGEKLLEKQNLEILKLLAFSDHFSSQVEMKQDNVFPRLFLKNSKVFRWYDEIVFFSKNGFSICTTEVRRKQAEKSLSP